MPLACFPMKPDIQPVILVDQNGNCLSVSGVLISGQDSCSEPTTNRPIQVDSEGKLITSKARIGDGAATATSPALPGAGAEGVTAALQQTGFEDVVLSVFADQPGTLFVEESYDGVGSFRRTAAILVNQPNALMQAIYTPSRSFFRVVWLNQGAAAVTVLEVTVVRRGNCTVGGLTTISP